MVNSDEDLLSVLATLEQCRTTLRQAGNGDTAQLISVAILDLRMKLHRIGDAELKALCEAMLRDGDDSSGDGGPLRRRPQLRLVK